MTANRNIVCPSCAAVNRIPAARPAEAARCGKCGAPLFDGHPADVDAAAFTRQIQRSDIPVLVDVWAPWCGPCRMMAPAYAEASKSLEPEVRMIKLNSDAEPSIAGQLNVRGIPTMILFKGGRPIAQTSGAMTASRIVEWTRAQLMAAAP
ncbi:MAG: thioredoxin TrxC [Gammaproteobacteria bacterium]|jgi:thioredoxin 2